MQIIRIYYNRAVFTSFWDDENITSLNTQLLVVGEHTASTFISERNALCFHTSHSLRTTQSRRSPLMSSLAIRCPFAVSICHDAASDSLALGNAHAHAGILRSVGSVVLLWFIAAAEV
jgi:hypothetical protein